MIWHIRAALGNGNNKYDTICELFTTTQKEIRNQVFILNKTKGKT